MNVCCFAGRLTHTPELRHTAAGSQLANFSLAINEYYYQDDVKKETVVFVNFTMWGSRAQFLSTLSPGTSLSVTGKYAPSKNTEGRVFPNFRVNDFTLLGNKKQSDNNENENEEKVGDDDVDVDDIPF